MKNKILAGILAVSLVCGAGTIPESIAPAVSAATSTDSVYEGFSYKIGFDNTVTITAYDKSSADIVVPDTIEELPVTAIGNGVFKDSLFGTSKITSIKLPDTLKIIGSNAFEGCNSIISIDIPDSVTSIGSCAFYRCLSLETITLPDSMTSIGYSAFYYCKNLTDISLPDGITKIANGTFEGCKNLKSITIPDSVTSIDYNAFADCKSLTEITIPDSVTTISSGILKNCDSLEKVVLSANIKTLYDIFSGCNNMKELIILNPECEFPSYYGIGIANTVNYTIYGYENSTAEEYAKTNNVRFNLLSEYPRMTFTTTTTTTATTTTTTTTTSTKPPTNNSSSGDVNGDGFIDAADASMILAYYAHTSTGGTLSFDEFRLQENAE